MYYRKFILASCLSISSLLLANQVIPHVAKIDIATMQTLHQIHQQSLQDKIPQQNIGNIMGYVALQLIGKKYVSHLLDTESYEKLYISTEKTDCMLFVENVFAIANMLKNSDISESTYQALITQTRYHGTISYCNRNHYFTDWANNAISSNIINDAIRDKTTTTVPKRFGILSQSIQESNNLHYNPEFIRCIIEREHYLESVNISMISLAQLIKNKHLLHAGDIVGMVRDIPKVDVTHMGIIYIDKDNNIGIINASLSNKKVVYEKDIFSYLTQYKKLQGIAILRVIQ